MRVYVRGAQKTWWGDWWETHPDGRRVRRRASLGLTAPTSDRAEALRALEQRIRATAPAPSPPRRHAKPKPSPLQAEPQVMTFGELLQAWLRSKRIEHQSKPRSIEAFESTARLLTRRWGALPARALTLDHLDDFKEARLRQVSAPTLNLDLDKLRNALRWGVKRGYLESYPPIERVRARGREVPKLLEPAQVDALLRLCTQFDTDHGSRFHRLEPVVRLALAAGLRADEARWLAWSDLDLDRANLAVTAKPGWTPKSSAERSVPLHDSFVAWIKRWREQLTERLGRRLLPGDWFAPFLPLEEGPGSQQGLPGQQWVRGVLTQEVRKLFQAAEIPPRGRHNLHKLRATFATRVLEGGGSLEALRHLLGHADIRTTAVYLEATDQARRNAVLCAGWDD